MLDLKVINGTLVIPGVGIVKAGVGIKDGKVVQIAEESQLPEAKKTFDATGKHVLPGLVDPHVHLGICSDFASECVTETQAALAGGVTTIGVFMGGGNSYLDQLDDMLKVAESKISTDMFLHLSIFTPEQMEEIPEYIERYGITSFKFYMCGVRGVFPNVSDAFFLQGLRKIAQLGDDITACVHCEDQSMVDMAFEQVSREKPNGTLADWADCGPNEAEEEAVIRACYLAQKSGARVYLVHMSTEEGVNAAAKLRPNNLFVETTSAYLSVSKNDEIGLLGKMLPPLKGEKDIDALWEAVKNDTIDTIGTDNVSMNKESKRAEEGMLGSMPGYPIIQTHLPVLLHEGYHKRGVSLEKIVKRTCRRPAEIFGLYPRKGTIAIGGDADLVVVDLEKEIKVDPAQLHTFGDFSLYQGKTLKGWPVATIKSGMVVVEDNQLLAQPGIGNYIRRGR